LDMRLFTKEAIVDTLEDIKALQQALLVVAEANNEVIIPGYTHLQVAQPVLLAHHFLAYFEMLQRDSERFKDCLKRVDVLPLGSGALAGVAYDIDRDFVAGELGFSAVSRNSMDAVSDRDFVLEYEAAASVCMMHLSRLAEEMVIWSSAEFAFIELDDAYATGSSIMPQKKNPDTAELARGKTGRVYGHLIALLTVMKGLPLAYDKDLQEDKEGLFDTVDTLHMTLAVFAGMIKTLKVNAESAKKAAGRGYILATDLADYLVKKGGTFRQAHEIVGKLVKYAADKSLSFADLNLAEYKKFSPLFGADVRKITIETSLAARNVPGGTAPVQVKKALAHARRLLKSA
jgi:argininosuccinate lyase